MTPAAARTVPFFDYRKLFTQEETQLVEIFRDVGGAGRLYCRPTWRGSRSNLSRFLGAGCVLGVGNATDGLLIALRAVGVASGEK